MKYCSAKKLKIGDKVEYINGRNKPTTPHIIIDIEDDEEYKDIFIRCEDNKLYHHTAFKE